MANSSSILVSIIFGQIHRYCVYFKDYQDHGFTTQLPCPSVTQQNTQFGAFVPFFLKNSRLENDNINWMWIWILCDPCCWNKYFAIIAYQRHIWNPGIKVIIYQVYCLNFPLLVKSWLTYEWPHYSLICFPHFHAIEFKLSPFRLDMKVWVLLILFGQWLSFM